MGLLVYSLAFDRDGGDRRAVPRDVLEDGVAERGMTARVVPFIHSYARVAAPWPSP
jgi:hypothetical protein